MVVELSRPAMVVELVETTRHVREDSWLLLVGHRFRPVSVGDHR